MIQPPMPPPNQPARCAGVVEAMPPRLVAVGEVIERLMGEVMVGEVGVAGTVW